MVQRTIRDLAGRSVTEEEISCARNTRSELANLSDNTVRTALEQPPYWEVVLFLQGFTDQINAYGTLRSAQRSGTMPGPHDTISAGKTPSWITERLHEAAILAQEADAMMNERLPVAFRPPGEPGDAAAILLVGVDPTLVSPAAIWPQ